MFAPLPFEGRSGVALGLVLAYYSIPTSTGVPAQAGFWNYAVGGFEPTFDPTKHLKPFARLGLDGSDPDYKLQVCSAPAKAFDGCKASAYFYAVGPDGGKAELIQVLDPKTARETVGL